MDSTLACLAAWMPRQRWYAGKGRPPSLRLVGWWDLDADDDANARIRTFVVADEAALPVVRYQVPVAIRPTETVDAPESTWIGSPEPGVTFIDGPTDPAYARALLSLATSDRAAVGPQMTATGHPAADLEDEDRTATVLTGEQSNTSIIHRAARTPVICKVFRQLSPGLNPDIELATALARAGSPHVPASYGWVEGRWNDGAGEATGSLAFVQEFLPDVEDAWRVALRAAARGDDFSEPAARLGEATADVHLLLAELFPTRENSVADREATAATWHRRLTIALAEVPAIAERAAGIEAVYRRAADSAWPRRQRIHGDYHLGQVLHHAERGWVLLDFEGEPLRPMRERIEPDLAIRDVAGMLRSFDYVAGSLRRDDPDRSADGVLAWASRARAAFVAGYGARTGAVLDQRDPVLAAMELDKAVYEAIYESRNRPTWVAIPLRAISRLLDATG